MKILYRYLLGRIIVATIISVIVLTFVLVLGNAFKRIFDLLINNEVPLWIIAKMVFLLIPQVLTFTLPWGLLIGVLIVFGCLSHDLELQSVHSAGIGLVPFISPVILLSLVATLLCFYNNASLAPRAMTEFKLMLVDMGKNNPTAFIRAGEPITRFPGYRLYVDKKDGNIVENIHIWELDSQGIPKRSIRADQGNISADLKDLSLTLTLTNARQEERQKDHIYSGMRAQQLPLKVSLKEALDTANIKQNISINTIHQLGARIFNPHASKINFVPLLTELQKRVAFSFAPFTFVLVGIPLALQFHRRETSIGFVLSLAIVISYYLVVILAMALKDKAAAYPELIVWTPNILFQSLGFFLIWHANYHKS
ncbi:MAG: LptF/LptG family permease [Verrucomicrobiota bacterium]